MKTKALLTTIILVVFLNSVGYAQLFFDISQTALIKNTNPSNGLKWGESTTKCLQVFGQPSSITDVYSEIDETTLKRYKYGNNTLEFLDGKLIFFEVVDNTFSVGTINGAKFTIGDPIINESYQILIPGQPNLPPVYQTNYRKIFNGYPLTLKSGTSTGKNYNAISIVPLKNGATQTDYRIQLLFNGSDQLFNIQVLD